MSKAMKIDYNKFTEQELQGKNKRETSTEGRQFSGWEQLSEPALGLHGKSS